MRRHLERPADYQRAARRLRETLGEAVDQAVRTIAEEREIDWTRLCSLHAVVASALAAEATGAAHHATAGRVRVRAADGSGETVFGIRRLGFAAGDFHAWSEATAGGRRWVLDTAAGYLPVFTAGRGGPALVRLPPVVWATAGRAAGRGITYEADAELTEELAAWRARHPTLVGRALALARALVTAPPSP